MKLLRREVSDDAQSVVEPQGNRRHLGPSPDRSEVAPLRPAAVLRRFEGALAGDPSGFTTLLDRIRVRAAQGMPARTLVFATPTPSSSAGSVMEGLAAQAEQLGLQVVRGELRSPLARSQPARRALPAAERPTRHALTVAPRPTTLDAEVRTWLGQHRDADLVLIEGPPLLQSIDAALVGRACDGLILIGERGITDRRALQEAASRARVSGCPLVGVVTTGPRSTMPAWLQRLIGWRPRPFTL